MSKQSSGGLGCGGVILSCLIIWGFIFGVTWKGHHYDIECSCNRGVMVE